MPKDVLAEPNRKQVEFAKRENEILKAAISLFEGPRWETVTVEQISKKAEIGKGTVYKHFTCKEEIYANIAADFSKRILSAYDVIDFEHQVEESAVLDAIQKIIRISFDLFLNNPVEAKMSFYCKRADFRERLPDNIRQQFEALDSQFEAYIGSILQKGIEMGMFPSLPLDHLMMGLEATFDGAIGMIWNGDINCLSVTDQDTYVSIISEFMIAGLVGLKSKELGGNIKHEEK
ncbi:MAG: TetR/AcrR family transcriptional regulator [Oleiphilus sp.]